MRKRPVTLIVGILLRGPPAVTEREFKVGLRPVDADSMASPTPPQAAWSGPDDHSAPSADRCSCNGDSLSVPTILEAALRDASLAVSVMDEDRQTVWSNRATDALLGMPVAQAGDEINRPRQGVEWTFFDSHGEHYDFLADLDRCLRTHEPLSRRMIGVRRPDGSLLWADAEVIPVPACRCGARWHAAIISTDLTERRFAEQVLHQLAFSDPLTGLANRIVLEDRLGAVLGRERRGGAPSALYYFDLDRFKPVNDQHGHEVGDAVLRSVGTRLTSAFRAEDTVARLGGDEFAALVEDVTDGEEQASRARDAVQAPIRITAGAVALRLNVGVSIGHVEARASDDPENLLRRADQAMYADKRRRSER